MNPHSRPKIAIEDLLRVKRAERPPAEFWTRFEQELRAKQLAAIVERRPWWQGAAQLAGGLARLRLPLGLTAAVAVAVFSVSEYRRSTPAAPENVSAAVVATMTGTELASDSSSAHPAPATMASAAEVTEAAVTAPPLPVSNVRPGEISRVISMLGVEARQDEARRDATPSARLIAANLALVQMNDSGLPASLAANRGFETRGLPAAHVNDTEPLAEISSPRYRSSARYLTTALPAGYVFETAAARPVATVRHVNDRQLRDDNVSRVGVDNGGVFLKL
ncbi:MAG TPA: hypothetical protein VG838_05795 [Opitutaceae bacterium]|nr:hypothetical protein [Opitutaceae bacterium]